MSSNNIKGVFIIICFIVISVLFNICTHIYDNKYYNHDTDGISGVASVSSKQAKDTVCLISGWEFFESKLYDSEFFRQNSPIPDVNIDIGEFKGFEFGDKNASPHGYGTYRIILLLEQEERSYSIDMPEIFSSYKMYVNGKLFVQNGNPDPDNYQSEIVNTIVTFNASERAEIIIQVADYDHYYSGIIYPPIFGETTSIIWLTNLREFICNSYMLVAFMMILIYLMFYFVANRDKNYLIFVALCLSYLLYTSYPIIHSIFRIESYVWYQVEDMGFVLMLGILAYLVSNKKKIQSQIIIAYSLCSVAFVLVLPEIQGTLAVYEAYGVWMDIYKILMFTCIIINSMLKIYNNKVGKTLLMFGTIFFGISVAFDYPGMWYEPIVFGWGAQIGGFVICLIIGIIFFIDIMMFKRQNTMLIIREAETKKYIDEVIHDLKSPLFGITSLTEMSRIGIEDGDVLVQIEERAFELSRRIDRLTEEKIKNRNNITLSLVDSIEFLKNLTQKYQVIANRKSVEIKVTGKNFEISIDVDKIELALENLIINAIRHSSVGGEIILEAYSTYNDKGFIVHDNGMGIDEDKLELMLKRGVSTQNGHMGIGLSIVSDIARIHGGFLDITSQKNVGSSFAIKL